MNRIALALAAAGLALGAARARAADQVLGREAAPLARPAPSLTVVAGATLRTRPTFAAPVVTVVDDPTPAELVEERAGWRRVRMGLTSGWLAPEGADQAGTAGAPGTFEVDRDRLARALARLPADSVARSALGVTLRAPADAAPQLERWTTVAHQAIRSWPTRLGVEPVGLDGATVAFAPGTEEPGDDAEAPGSAGGGVALLRLGERSDDAVEALLVHELSHLASERTFPRGLPIWLEEGIAEWLAREPLGGDGNSLPGMLRGEVTVAQEGNRRRVDFSGPLADLIRMAREAQAGKLPPLDLWTAIPASEFSGAAARGANYALAGSFARFLFEADEARATVVREVLSGAVAGELDVDAELDRRLGDVGELDRAFRAWLIEESDRQLLPALP